MSGIEAVAIGIVLTICLIWSAYEINANVNKEGTDGRKDASC